MLGKVIKIVQGGREIKKMSWKQFGVENMVAKIVGILKNRGKN